METVALVFFVIVIIIVVILAFHQRRQEGKQIEDECASIPDAKIETMNRDIETLLLELKEKDKFLKAVRK